MASGRREGRPWTSLRGFASTAELLFFLGITTGRGFAPTSICRTGGSGSWSRSDRRPSREASPSPYPFRRRFAAPGLCVPCGLRESEARACSSAGQSAPLIRVRSVVQIDSGPPYERRRRQTGEPGGRTSGRSDAEGEARRRRGSPRPRAGRRPIFKEDPEAVLQKRGRSSAGRAPALQAGGRRFEPGRLHQFWGLASASLETAFPSLGLAAPSSDGRSGPIGKKISDSVKRVYADAMMDPPTLFWGRDRLGPDPSVFPGVGWMSSFVICVGVSMEPLVRRLRALGRLF